MPFRGRLIEFSLMSSRTDRVLSLSLSLLSSFRHLLLIIFHSSATGEAGVAGHPSRVEGDESCC